MTEQQPACTVYLFHCEILDDANQRVTMKQFPVMFDIGDTIADLKEKVAIVVSYEGQNIDLNDYSVFKTVSYFVTRTSRLYDEDPIVINEEYTMSYRKHRHDKYLQVPHVLPSTSYPSGGAPATPGELSTLYLSPYDVNSDTGLLIEHFTDEKDRIPQMLKDFPAQHRITHIEGHLVTNQRTDALIQRLKDSAGKMALFRISPIPVGFENEPTTGVVDVPCHLPSEKKFKLLGLVLKGMFAPTEPTKSMLVVTYVFPNSRADKAGIRVHDRIFEGGLGQIEGIDITLSEICWISQWKELKPKMSAPTIQTFLRQRKDDDYHKPLTGEAVARGLSVWSSMGYLTDITVKRPI